jgi:hypothetical protein
MFKVYNLCCTLTHSTLVWEQVHQLHSNLGIFYRWYNGSDFKYASWGVFVDSCSMVSCFAPSQIELRIFPRSWEEFIHSHGILVHLEVLFSVLVVLALVALWSSMDDLELWLICFFFWRFLCTSLFELENKKVCGTNSKIESLLLCYQLFEGMLEKGLVNGYGSLLVEMVGSGREILQVLCSAYIMDHLHSRRCPLCETIDIHRVPRRHEDFIIDNRNLIFSITSMMHS